MALTTKQSVADSYWSRTASERIAYNQGRFARQQNKPWDANPYPPDNLRILNAWQQGWHDEDDLS